MANQVTLTGCMINFAAGITNNLNGSSQGDWEIGLTVYIPAGGDGTQLYGLGAYNDFGASSPRFLYTENGSAVILRDANAQSSAWVGDHTAFLNFDDLNTYRIVKVASNPYPDIYVNDNLLTRTQSSGAWETVPPFGNIGAGSFRYEGRTIAGFSYTDNIAATTVNDRLFSFDGEAATPQIAETINNQHPSFSGAGTPVWSTAGGGSPTIDADVQEGADINIYTGEGLTGTPSVLIDGVSVPYTGALPNLVVSTDLVAKTDVFHGFDLDAPLVLRVEHDAGGYDNEVIIRSRAGYKRTQLAFPDSGAGTLNSLLTNISVGHNDIVYYPEASNTAVNERGYFMTDAASVDLLIGKYAESGVFWYPYTLSLSAIVPPDTTKPVITLVSGTDTITEGDSWTDAGATASDNVDGDITGNIIVTGTVDANTAGSYQVNYNVSDTAGNAADQVARTVTVNQAPDVTKPVITLLGASSQTVRLGNTYIPSGSTASDDRDGNITGSIVVTGAIDTDTAGVYTEYHNVTDAAGNAADEVTRTITVEADEYYQLNSGDQTTEEYVLLPRITIPANTAFEIELCASFDPTANFRPFGNISTFADRLQKYANNDTFRWTFDGNMDGTLDAGIVYTDCNVYTFGRDESDNMYVKVNGVTQTGFGPFTKTGNYSFDALLTHGSITNSRGASSIRYFGVKQEAEWIRYYSPTSTQGTGVVLKDIIADEDASLESYDGVTDSWWTVDPNFIDPNFSYNELLGLATGGIVAMAINLAIKIGL